MEDNSPPTKLSAERRIIRGCGCLGCGGPGAFLSLAGVGYYNAESAYLLGHSRSTGPIALGLLLLLLCLAFAL